MATHNKKKPKIIFWGTPEFAIPSLQELLNEKYPVIAVVSNPDEPAGRDKKLTEPPIKKIAKIHHLPVLQPATLSDEYFRHELPEADLFIIAAYGKIIPQDILSRASCGVLNIHPSLLPQWRGPSPIQFSIMHGDKITGVSIMLVDERMDHGPLLAVERVAVTLRITYPELHDMLAKKGATLLLHTISRWIDKKIIPIPQNDDNATYSKILKKDDGRINWKMPAEKIDRQIRAYTPWPGTWTLWPGKEKIMRLRIEKAEAITGESTLSPGAVTAQKDRLLVHTGKGMLKIEMLTVEGKKPSNVSSFLRGYPAIASSVLV